LVKGGLQMTLVLEEELKFRNTNLVPVKIMSYAIREAAFMVLG